MKSKFLSLLLVFSLLIPLLSPLTAIAETQTATAIPTAPSEDIRMDAEAAPAVSEIEYDGPVQGEALTNDNLPFAMTETDAALEGLIGRVKDAERDLHSVVFANADGGLTLYYYNEPVKYVDEDGNIRDKSNKLSTRLDGNFETVASDIQAIFPKQFSDGITLRKGEWELGLTPAGSFTASGTLSADQTTVTYARDLVTRYQYNLTSMGFKEDIVVNRYTGQTHYSFVLKTHGLTPVNQYGTWVLVDESNTVRACIGDVIIFTADERNNTLGELQVEEVIAGQEYRLTIVMDADWLADEATVYPITIDPALTYANTTANIQDITVCQGTTYSATSGSLYVGRNSNGNVRRALMRFPNLNILGYNITSATVSVRDLMCESWALPMQCYQYTGNDWSDSNPITWSGMGDTSVGIYLSGHSVCYVNGKNSSYCATPHRYVYDITQLAEMWAAGTASPSKGVVFRATGYYEDGTTNTYKTFASINRGGSYIPNIEISYTPRISIAVPSTTTLEEGNTLTLTATTVPANTTVTWSSGNTSIATVSSSGVVTAVHAGNVTITATAEDGSASIELLVTLPEGVYRIANNYSNLYLATRLSGASAIDVFQNGMVTSEPACTTIMWWVCHHGNGMYSFQPMSRLAYGLTYSSADNSARVSSLTTSYWKIAYDSYGYTITNEGYSHRTLSLESDTTNIGEDVIVTSQSGYLTRQRWSFSAVTTEYNGVILFNSDTGGNVSTATKRYVAVGKTRGIFELGIKATAYSTDSVDQDIYWTSSNSLIAQVNSSTGQVTGMSPGTVTITAYKANESGTGGVGISDSYTIIVPELTDDTYYIRNRQHDKYVQADDATAPTYSMPGVALEQWEFDGGTHQRWELEVQYNGYYRIKSVKSGLYIATQAGGEGTEDLFILQENYVNTDRQLWKITFTSHGSYKVKAKSSEPYDADLAMVAANIVNDSSNGIQVQQRLYVDNESYKDEWELIESVVSFVNYYDSSIENNAAMMSFIQDANMFVNSAYSDAFGMQFKMDGTAIPTPDSYLSECTHGVNSHCENDCGSNHFNHHKSIERISNFMYYEPRESNHIYTLWTNRPPYTYCAYQNNNHCYICANAVVVENRPVIHIMNLDIDDNDDLRAVMAIILAHETAHTFGMPEVYSSAHDQTNGYNCIMEYLDPENAETFYESVLGGYSSAFCDSCQSTMLGLIYTNMHLGNES
ncbi:MAG: Ig-like domain-containing protein [Eubacteriales bacterium]